MSQQPQPTEDQPRSPGEGQFPAEEPLTPAAGRSQPSERPQPVGTRTRRLRIRRRRPRSTLDPTMRAGLDQTPHLGQPVRPPASVAAARLILYVNAVAFLILAVLAAGVGSARGQTDRALGLTIAYLIPAVLCGLMGLRVVFGRRRTRIYINILSLITLVIGLLLLTRNPLFGMVIGFCSVAVLAMVNTERARIFFRQDVPALTPPEGHDPLAP